MQAAEIEPVSLAGVKLDLGDKRHLRTVAYAPRSQSYTLTKEQVPRAPAESPGWSGKLSSSVLK